MRGNNDLALGDEFDDLLTQVITQLTEDLQLIQKPSQSLERGRVVVQGKRDLMKLLVDKTSQYLQCCDPACEIVVQEMTAQYESLIESMMLLLKQAQSN